MRGEALRVAQTVPDSTIRRITSHHDSRGGGGRLCLCTGRLSLPIGGRRRYRSRERSRPTGAEIARPITISMTRLPDGGLPIASNCSIKVTTYGQPVVSRQQPLV